MSRVPTSKRGEILVMKRLGFLHEQARPTSTATEAYDSIFVGKLNRAHTEAMRELFLDADRPVGRGDTRKACLDVCPQYGCAV